MKVLIAVPTYKRPYILEKRAWYFLKDLKNADVRVFCDEDEEMYYEQVAGDRVVVGAKQGKPDGLISQLNFIGEYARNNGYDIVWKVDDKLTLHKGGVKKKDIVPYIDEYILKIVDKFKEGADAIGTCKAREYLHSDKSGFQPRYKPFDASYFLKSEYLSLDTNVFSMDELQVYFKLATEDHLDVWTCFDMYIDNPMGKFEGGLQMFDRLEESKNCLEILTSKYPEIRMKQSRSETSIDVGWNIDYSFYRDKFKKHFTNL